MFRLTDLPRFCDHVARFELEYEHVMVTVHVFCLDR